VVAAAVVLSPPVVRELLREGLGDSKKLRPASRERLCGLICSRAVAVRVQAASWRRIDGTNILAASLWAMSRAVLSLPLVPDLVVVDGPYRIPSLPFRQIPLVRGDGRSAPVMAASIVAKVLRDRVMRAFDRIYPGYGLAGHKGYPSAAHREALMRLGPCPIHRRTFRGVAER
jgi:ribonuclease HII